MRVKYFEILMSELGGFVYKVSNSGEGIDTV